MTGKDAYRWVAQTCPICEKPPTQFLGRRGGSAHRQNLGLECEIWRCAACGLVFPNPMPVPVEGVDQQYDINPDEYFVHDEGEKNEEIAVILRKAEEVSGGKGRLLEIGVGKGELLLAARLAGWSVTGVEPSATFAEYAARHSGAEIRQEAVEHCNFESNSFDVVILSAVLEHLFNPNEVVKEISRILRPGGAVYIAVPNEDEGLYFRVGNLYEKLRRRDWVVNLAPTFPPFHVFGYGPRSLRALLTKHGLEPKELVCAHRKSMVPAHGGAGAFLEQQAAKTINVVSKIGMLGTYITTWAIKV